MRRIAGEIGSFLEERTGIVSAVRSFMSEDIPSSAGWPQIFGSIALFLFLIQALTGVLLTLNYSPAVGGAYTSVRYIVHDVAGGRLIQGLHHWGASMIVIVIFLHMAQVFIFGAFRKPREATWIIGVFLLLLTLAFGLTGYLLPWDNRAYWGTMVTTKIIAGLPLMGPVLTNLIGATPGVGVITFSRFYAFHTVLLPGTTAVLIFIHLYLVRRHGITAASVPNRTQSFYPNQLLRDFSGIFLAFVGLFLAAAFLDAPLERMADPTDTSYVPRPEWYFLFLFQLLKLFPGKLELLGTFVLPSLAVTALLLLPFLNKINVRFLSGPIQSTVLVVLVFSVWAGLTGAAGWTPPHSSADKRTSSAAAEWALIQPEEIAGLGYFRSLECNACHNLVQGTPKPGPTLGVEGLRHPKDWLVAHFKQQAKPTDASGPTESMLNSQEQNALLLFVARLRPESIRVIKDMSSQFVGGAQLFVGNACGSCHKVNGVGGEIGPPLNGLSNRRSEAWIRAHFAAPRRLSPGSIMPPYHFKPSDERQLTEYLLSLAK